MIPRVAGSLTRLVMFLFDLLQRRLLALGDAILYCIELVLGKMDLVGPLGMGLFDLLFQLFQGRVHVSIEHHMGRRDYLLK